MAKQSWNVAQQKVMAALSAGQSSVVGVAWYCNRASSTVRSTLNLLVERGAAVVYQERPRRWKLTAKGKRVVGKNAPVDVFGKGFG
jgi:predicted transcriptional regulator